MLLTQVQENMLKLFKQILANRSNIVITSTISSKTSTTTAYTTTGSLLSKSSSQIAQKHLLYQQLRLNAVLRLRNQRIHRLQLLNQLKQHQR